jgi:hypothetical protein
MDGAERAGRHDGDHDGNTRSSRSLKPQSRAGDSTARLLLRGREVGGRGCGPQRRAAAAAPESFPGPSGRRRDNKEQQPTVSSGSDVTVKLQPPSHTTVWTSRTGMGPAPAHTQYYTHGLVKRAPMRTAPRRAARNPLHVAARPSCTGVPTATRHPHPGGPGQPRRAASRGPSRAAAQPFRAQAYACTSRASWAAPSPAPSPTIF